MLFLIRAILCKFLSPASLFATAALQLLVMSHALEAQFVQTSSGVFQSADGQAKIITSHTVPGLFVLFGPPIALQLFDPARIEPSKELSQSYAHLFIEYDPSFDRYSMLHLGSQKLRIKGGFTVLIRAGARVLRLTVDNNNPYFSAVLDQEGSSGAAPNFTPSIVGFRGVKLVVNKTGQQPVALLEANQFNQFRGIIEPYEYREEALYVKGVKLTGNSLGVELEPQKNLCLKPDTAFLNETNIKKLKGELSKEALIESLEKTLEAPPTQDPFKGLLLLRIEPSEIVGLDYGSNTVKVFRPLKSTSKQVCVTEDIPLD